MPDSCLFCTLPPARVVDREGPVLAFLDGYPVSPGHTLLVPARHVASFRDLTPSEWAAVHVLLLRRAAALRAADPSITGFNVGINDGSDAGQTIFHCHVHLIPRRPGDHPHPRGGVRAVIPALADYPSPS
jgi:diadenosine tetraphosphate (Ap4A) HIT family hydrolase